MWSTWNAHWVLGSVEIQIKIYIKKVGVLLTDGIQGLMFSAKALCHRETLGPLLKMLNLIFCISAIHQLFNILIFSCI